MFIGVVKGLLSAITETGSSCCVFKVLRSHSPLGTEEHQENPQPGQMMPQQRFANIRTCLMIILNVSAYTLPPLPRLATLIHVWAGGRKVVQHCWVGETWHPKTCNIGATGQTPIKPRL